MIIKLKEFPDWLRTQRVTNAMSFRTMAKLTDVSESDLCKIANKIINPKVEKIYKIVKALYPGEKITLDLD